MKQIYECLDRVFGGKKSLLKKWKAAIVYGNDCNRKLVLYHYQHLILIANLDKNLIEYAWWEVDADKRGLISAIEYLLNKNLFENSLAVKKEVANSMKNIISDGELNLIFRGTYGD